MTITDKNNIKLLYHFYRYNKESISKLFGRSPTRIKAIIAEEQNITVTPLDDCVLCGLDGAKQYYINGDEDNNNPQNKIMLCEPCVRRIKHLQIKKFRGIARSLY